jgi:hypothetical protein
MLQSITKGIVWNYRGVLRQDIPNDILNFNANAVFQDFVLFGLPANHIILNVQIEVETNFVLGENNTVTMYVGDSNVFTNPEEPVGNSNINKCYCSQLLSLPSNTIPGTSDTFTFSAPGTPTIISEAFCVPQRFDAFDIIARVVSNVNINLITQGEVHINVQYTQF